MPQTYRFPLPFLQSLTTLALPFPVRVHFRFPFSPFRFLIALVGLEGRGSNRDAHTLGDATEARLLETRPHERPLARRCR